jgi:hypothetical protein
MLQILNGGTAENHKIHKISQNEECPDHVLFQYLPNIRQKHKILSRTARRVPRLKDKYNYYEDLNAKERMRGQQDDRGSK